jgi:succinoglycan biosynthesis protein ExoA
MPSAVSVIVPVRNESQSIESTLRSLLTQDFPRDQFEVIVADGGSDDDTVIRVRRLQDEFPNLKLVFNPVRYSSGGRNAGVRLSKGEFTVIVDGHCHVPDRHYLTHLVSAFETSGADCLGRPQPLDVPHPTAFQSAVAIARASRLGHNPESDIYSHDAKFVEPQSTAVAYRRKVFHTIGVFDPRFDACEDVEFNQRVHDAGLSCYFTPTVTIVYHPRKSLSGLFSQLSRYGMGRARLAKKWPRSLTIPALVPPTWAVWLVIGLFAAMLSPMMAWVYAGLFAMYALVIVAGSVWLGRSQTWAIRTRLPVVLLGIHFGFAWGFLREMLGMRFGSRRAVVTSL